MNTTLPQSKIVIINGYSRVGKDTLIRRVKEKSGLRVEEWSVADLARETICKVLDMYDDDLKQPQFADDYRQALISTTNLLKATGKVWQDLENKIEYYDYYDDNWVDKLFVHCRETKDFSVIKRIAERWGWKLTTIWVMRQAIDPANDQDAQAMYYNYDHTILLPELDSESYNLIVDFLIKL